MCSMRTPNHDTRPATPLDRWDRPPERIEPLPGQLGIFEYQPHVTADGQVEMFDTGRDLPGASDEVQRLLWDVD